MRPKRWRAPYSSVCRTKIGKLTGLKILEGIRDRTLHPAPFSELLGVRLADVAKGHAIFEADPSRAHYNSDGCVHGGFTFALLDFALGSAVKSLLPPATSHHTIDAHARLLCPITEETGLVRCEGRVVSVSRSFATAAAEVVDRRGRVLATGTAACAIRPHLTTLHRRLSDL
jgi:uncharacterized protein (TIGR00369 family)